ncbi:MAG: hypothetical protein M3437_01820 [Chloroflexota bacterium]|nr:hypothetical protein [Chloroflexota bacterium]MDQ5866326.1 hypothetical protein [Chloroflexota bacterium]
MPDYTDDISIMEDLDPEPLAQGRGYTREFVLGGLLLLLVVVWAGWQSWQQAAKQQSYRQAEEAVTRQDWGLAYDYFRSASGYRDAGARAEQVEKLIQERDRHYRAATTAINRRQWVTALDELHGVRNIQAEYWDVDSLYADVEAQVYSNTLKGAIALRAGAEPPGLYYRTAGEWVWLDGSDRWSQVLGATADSVAYDVPGDNWQPGVTPTPVPFNRQPPPGRPELEGRKLKVATLGDSAVTTRDSTLDPAFYSYYLPTGDRLVAGRHNERQGSHINAVRIGFAGWWLDYEQVEEGRAVSSTLSLGKPEETVLHVSPESARYLVAVAGGLSVRSSKLELYLAVRGEGGEFTRQPIYSHVGQFGGGQISPDGRYALLTTITPVDNGASEVQSSLLFDLVAGTPPYTLTTRTVPVETVGSFVSFDTWVKGVFLNEGQNAGKVLLVERDMQQLDVRLVDPENVEASTVLARLEGNRYISYVTEKPGSSELLIHGWAIEGTAPVDFAETTRLLFIRLAPGEEASIMYLPTIEVGYVRSFGTYGGQVVYEQRTNSSQEWNMEVYALSGDGAGPEGEIAPTQVFSATVLPMNERRSTGYSSTSPSWYPGEGAFAYVQGGSLFARDYEGGNEVKLEASVLQLIDPRTYLNASYFR